MMLTLNKAYICIIFLLTLSLTAHYTNVRYISTYYKYIDIQCEQKQIEEVRIIVEQYIFMLYYAKNISFFNKLQNYELPKGYLYMIHRLIYYIKIYLNLRLVQKDYEKLNKLVDMIVSENSIDLEKLDLIKDKDIDEILKLYNLKPLHKLYIVY